MKRLLLFFAVLIFSSTYVWAQNSDKDVKELEVDFGVKAEKIWKDRIESLFGYSCDGTISIQTNASKPNQQNSPKYVVSRYEFDADFPNFVFDVELVSNDDSETSFNEQYTAFGCNDKYQFALLKESESTQWAIRELKPAPRQIDCDELWRFLTDPSGIDAQPSVTTRMYARTTLSEFILPDDRTSIMALTSSPLFMVTQNKRLENGVIRTSFIVDKDEKGNNPFGFQSGTIDFTSDDLRVLAATLSFGKGECSMQCEYQTTGETMTLVSKKVTDTYGNGMFTEDRFSFNFSKKAPDSTRFSLARYGLPEPDFNASAVLTYEEDFYLSPEIARLENSKPGTEEVATFQLTNVSSKVISVVGEKSGCSCCFDGDIPITVKPGETRDVKIRVNLPNDTIDYDQEIILMIATSQKLAFPEVRIFASLSESKDTTKNKTVDDSKSSVTE